MRRRALFIQGNIHHRHSVKISVLYEGTHRLRVFCLYFSTFFFGSPLPLLLLVELERLGSHGERPLVRLVPSDEPGGVDEDAPLDARQLVERGVADAPPRGGERLAVLETGRGERDGLNPPAALVVLVQRVLGQRLDPLLLLELEQVFLPGAVAGELHDLAGRVDLLGGVRGQGPAGLGSHLTSRSINALPNTMPPRFLHRILLPAGTLDSIEVLRF